MSNRSDRNEKAMARFGRPVRIVTGRKVTKIEFPGGESRKIVRCYLDDDTTVIASKRSQRNRSNRESNLMRVLTGERRRR